MASTLNPIGLGVAQLASRLRCTTRCAVRTVLTASLRLRLQVLSRDGEQKHTIGNYGRSTGQMVSCKGMACDGESLF